MKILLAEDERSMSNALKAILTKNNYSVDAVFDGEEAASYALACEYDVIIMDIMMPKMNGIDSLKEIRKKGCTVPVIMLTAKSEVDDKVMGLDAGANDYLTKPFATKELLARLRALTRSPQVAADNSLHVGNLTLDRGTFELYIMDKIWGIDSEADISVVWTYISFLRKKLVSLEANVQINAKRNAGYTLEAKGD